MIYSAIDINHFNNSKSFKLLKTPRNVTCAVVYKWPRTVLQWFAVLRTNISLAAFVYKLSTDHGVSRVNIRSVRTAYDSW